MSNHPPKPVVPLFNPSNKKEKDQPKTLSMSHSQVRISGNTFTGVDRKWVGFEHQYQPVIGKVRLAFPYSAGEITLVRSFGS